MPRVDVSALSTEYIRVRVSATENGLAVNPTASIVELAFITARDQSPEEDDWVDGQWETSGSTYYARALVGPAGEVTLPAGYYNIWVRWSDGLEVPVKGLGTVYVY